MGDESRFIPHRLAPEVESSRRSQLLELAEDHEQLLNLLLQPLQLGLQFGKPVLWTISKEQARVFLGRAAGIGPLPD